MVISLERLIEMNERWFFHSTYCVFLMKLLLVCLLEFLLFAREICLCSRVLAKSPRQLSFIKCLFQAAAFERKHAELLQTLVVILFVVQPACLLGYRVKVQVLIGNFLLLRSSFKRCPARDTRVERGGDWDLVRPMIYHRQNSMFLLYRTGHLR